MKRDVDLCRRILLDIETNPRRIWIVPGQSNEQKYHFWLLKDIGCLTTDDNQSETTRDDFSLPYDMIPVRLTNKGHDFVEMARDDGRWNDAKANVLTRTGGLSFELIVSFLSKEAMKSLSYDA